MLRSPFGWTARKKDGRHARRHAPRPVADRLRVVAARWMAEVIPRSRIVGMLLSVRAGTETGMNRRSERVRDSIRVAYAIPAAKRYVDKRRGARDTHRPGEKSKTERGLVAYDGCASGRLCCRAHLRAPACAAGSLNASPGARCMSSCTSAAARRRAIVRATTSPRTRAPRWFRNDCDGPALQGPLGPPSGLDEGPGHRTQAHQPAGRDRRGEASVPGSVLEESVSRSGPRFLRAGARGLGPPALAHRSARRRADGFR